MSEQAMSSGPGSGSGSGRIVVVGEALVDLVISPDGSVEAAFGGAPFNTARACGRLGADVAFVGAISGDRFGRALRARLADDEVDVSGVTEVEVPTTLAAAEIDDRGAATYRFYLDGTSAPSLARVAPLGADVAVAYTGGLALVLEPMADAVAAMVAALARRRADDRPLVVIDVNARPQVIVDRARYLDRLRSVIAAADVVKVSDEDLEVVAPGVATLAAARALLDRGPAAVLVTAGAREVVILHRPPAPDDTSASADVTEVRVPVEPVEVVDTIGAGDAFGGGVCAWWTLTGRAPADLADVGLVERAVRAGVAVAGVACTRRGADPPRAADLPIPLTRF